MRAVLYIALLCMAGVYVNAKTLGIDLSIFSGAVSKEKFQCLRSHGYNFAIIQAFNGGRGFNPHAVQNAENAYAAGMTGVGFYIFACPKCGGNIPASRPIDTVANGLKGYSKAVRFWIDVEPCNGCWYGSTKDNLEYVDGVVTAAMKKFGSNKVGIYTSKYSWQGVVGSGTKPHFKTLPLWYALYDGKPEFTSINFGGWTKPYLKQYKGDQKLCGLDVDYNYLP